MCRLIEGETEVASEGGLVKLVIPYKKKGIPARREFLGTPNQMLALAKKLERAAALAMVPTAEVVPIKARAAV
jgi:hypothetical protein